MQNIKNFKLVDPSPELLKQFENPEGDVPLFLQSEDGKYWHDCYDLYDDDTIKIQYDSNNIIWSVVDEPIPQRGNIYAASMLFPENMSVAEIAGPLPTGFEIDSHTWLFDGTNVYQDTDLLAARIKRYNTSEFYRLLNRASSYLNMLQSCSAVGTAQSGDDELISELQHYLSDMRNVDLTQENPVWPMPPIEHTQEINDGGGVILS